MPCLVIQLSKNRKERHSSFFSILYSCYNNIHYFSEFLVVLWNFSQKSASSNFLFLFTSCCFSFLYIFGLVRLLLLFLIYNIFVWCWITFLCLLPSCTVGDLVLNPDLIFICFSMGGWGRGFLLINVTLFLTWINWSARYILINLTRLSTKDHQRVTLEMSYLCLVYVDLQLTAYSVRGHTYTVTPHPRASPQSPTDLRHLTDPYKWLGGGGEGGDYLPFDLSLFLGWGGGASSLPAILFGDNSFFFNLLSLYFQAIDALTIRRRTVETTFSSPASTESDPASGRPSYILIDT